MENQNSDIVEKTRKEIKELREQEEFLCKYISNKQITLNIIRSKIDKLYENFPKCYACEKHKDPNSMTIASKEDIENYKMSYPYRGPEIGEYYCFC